MNDIFYIGAYWKNRKQKVEDIIMPTLKVLEGLSVIDNQFQNIYELGKSKKEALQKNVPRTDNELLRLFLTSVKKTDVDGEGYSSIGYSVKLWNGQSDYESSSVSFNLGSSSSSISNSCLVKLPAEGLAKERLLEPTTVYRIIDLIIENFDPDILVLNSRRLQTELDAANEVGWITYKKILDKIPRVSDPIMHEPNYKRGHLFYLKTDSGLVYDYKLIRDIGVLKRSF